MARTIIFRGGSENSRELSSRESNLLILRDSTEQDSAIGDLVTMRAIKGFTAQICRGSGIAWLARQRVSKPHSLRVITQW